MALENTFEEELGNTLSKYAQVAISMNRFPEKTPISIREIAEEAKIHWNTTKKALIFFESIAPIIPKFEFIENKGKIQLLKKPKAIIALNKLFSSMEMKITTKMMMEKITSKDRGAKMKDLIKFLEEKEVKYLTNLLQKGLINSEEGRFYLSSKGKLIGNLGIKKLVNLGTLLPWEERDVNKKPTLRLKSINRTPTYQPGTFQTWKFEKIEKKGSIFCLVK
jgi:predicted transcriptional regulator